MGRRILEGNGHFDPDTLKLHSRAIDAAWQDIVGNIDAAAAEDRRIRLAISFSNSREEVSVMRMASKMPQCTT